MPLIRPQEIKKRKTMIAMNRTSMIGMSRQPSLLSRIRNSTEKISQIRSSILDLDRGVILKFHPEMTRDKVVSFCKFFGGAECGCLRFLKVTSWNKVKAMDRITRATLWRLYEVPRLRQQSRDVLDEFNANPKEAVFPLC